MFEELPVESLVGELARLSRLLDDDSHPDSGAGADVLPDAEVVDGLAAATAVAGWAEALSLRLVGRLRERRRVDHVALVASLGGQRAVEHAGGPASAAEVDRFTAVEVAAALRVSQRSAQERVELADTLARRQPTTGAALRAGVIGLSHARALRDALTGADDDVARLVEQRVITRRAARRESSAAPADAGTAWTLGTPAQLAASARRALAHVDPAGLARRCETARRTRGVSSWALPDGMAALQVTAPALDVAAAVEQVETLARAAVGAARRAAAGGGPDGVHVPTLEEARADAAMRLLLGTPDVVGQPVQHVSVGVDVLVPLDVLREVSEHHGTAPAELPGFGPLPTPLARALVRSARRVQVVPLDATGAVDTGPHGHEAGYRPSALLDRAVRARDTTCRWPGCHRRARRCDVDHTVAWPDGPTAGCNLACYCRLHHRAKHRGGWHVTQRGDGHLDHTAPTGHTYGTDPPVWSGRDGPGLAAPAATGPAPGDWWDPAWFLADWYAPPEPAADDWCDHSTAA